MKISLVKHIGLILMVLAPLSASANGLEEVLRTDGGRLVVAAVLGVIMAGILFYLFRLDRKLTKFERSMDARGNADIKKTTD